MQTGHIHRLVSQHARAPLPAPLDLFASVKQALGTETCDVTVLQSPRADAWQTAFAIALKPGQTVLALGLCPAAIGLGLTVERISQTGPNPEALRALSKRLGADRFDDVKAVFVSGADAAQLVEIRRLLDENFHDALLLVDSATGLDAQGFDMDLNEIDVAVIGLPGTALAPKGHTVLAISPKARPMLHIAAE